MKKKSGEKSNKCNQYEFASSRADNLRTHSKTHTEEKSNKCSQYDNKLLGHISLHEASWRRVIAVKKLQLLQRCLNISRFMISNKMINTPWIFEFFWFAGAAANLVILNEKVGLLYVLSSLPETGEKCLYHRKSLHFPS